jgi:hypothetical protein
LDTVDIGPPQNCITDQDSEVTSHQSLVTSHQSPVTSHISSPNYELTEYHSTGTGLCLELIENEKDVKLSTAVTGL